MNAPESETPRHAGARSFFFWPGLTGSGLLLLYVLSVPPVVKLAGNGPHPVLQRIYAPLEFAYKHNKAVENFYDWYFKLWGEKA